MNAVFQMLTFLQKYLLWPCNTMWAIYHVMMLDNYAGLEQEWTENMG